MKLARLLSIILLPLSLFAQAPAPYPITVDSERGTVPALDVFQANAVTYRASYKSGGVANNLAAVTPFLYWQPYGATNATVVTSRWTVISSSSGIVDFAFTPADLNFATGTYTYQVGLQVGGGPNVIKQGIFTIRPSQASVGANPIVFGSTNINWGSINWTGLPAYEYQTNTIAVSNALNSQISSASNALNTAIVNTSNALNTRVTATETGKVAKAGDTMSGNLGFTNAGLTSLDVIDWDLSPTSTVQQGRLQWEASRDTLKLGLDANVNLDMGQQLLMYGKSIETNTINKGEVVFVAGAAGDNPTVKRASNASESLSSRTIGIAAENIASNNNGFIVTRGTIYNVNTTNFTQGAMLYLGANGTLQTNLPEAPLHGVFIGTVERVGQNNGQIYVAIQNYQELEELSDVKITSVANNDLIVWNSASNRWQNSTLASLGISTSAGITVESDPIFVAASNSFYPRSNPSNFVTTATLSGYATGTPLYVETDPTALTNVTASGRITATPSGKQVALTFDASGLATGTPIYSVAGLATGTPLYAFTETDTIATNRLTNYYTITAADAKFATGTPLYVESAFNANSNRITALEGYTNRAASALSSSVWASADSTTNYALRTTFNSSTNFLNNKFTNYLPLAGGALEGNLDLNGGDINGLNAINFGSGRYIDSAGTMAGGDFTFSSVPVIPGYLTTSTWATADSTTNYASRITFNSTSNGFNTRITAVEAYTNRAASALSSSVWASADSTTNYASRVTFGSFTSSYATADATTNYASRITFNATSNSLNSRISNVATGAVYVTNLSAIAGSGLGVTSNRLVVTNISGNFEGLTGNRFSLGGLSVTNIATNAVAFIAAPSADTAISIGAGSHGAHQLGYFEDGTTVSIGQNSYGAAQIGNVYDNASIGNQAFGALQRGYFAGTLANISSNSVGSSQIGFFGTLSSARIGQSAYGASQIGYLLNGSATNNASGAIQVMGGQSGEAYVTTTNAYGSILVGPGTNNVAYSVRAAGGFYGNAIGLTNIQASALPNLSGTYLLLSTYINDTNRLQIQSGSVTQGQSGTFGTSYISGTNYWISLGSTNWVKFEGKLNSF